MRGAALPGAMLLACACAIAPAAPAAPAAELNLATLSCDKYENEIVGTPQSRASREEPPIAGSPQPAAGQRPDAIDLVMWLFGFSVARSGDHNMYGDALTSFGFALDAQCKDHPSASLLEATAAVRPNRDHPMDLTALNCGTWESRHAESARTDPESAKTIMMWLYGFSVGLSGRHLFDPAGLSSFTAALQGECTQHPNGSLLDTLSAVANPSARR